MKKHPSRRIFIKDVGLAGLSIPFMSLNCENPQPKTSTMHANKNKLGVALVGLGNYATGQLAPALQQTEHCYLAGIVTGTPSKAASWKEKYNIPEKNIYNYETFDQVKDNPAIDIVYVVLPNAMHAEYTIRAAKAGKHVICEKPMAVSVKEADEMIEACRKAGKFLSIGYRLHYDPYHDEIRKFGTQKTFGELKKINSAFSFVAPKGIWRLDKRLSGGGPLMDLGIYCLQAVCYTTGMEPIAVTAQSPPVTDTDKFKGVEETLDWQMEMPGGLVANCRTSYSESNNFFKVEATDGWFELQPAFGYSGLQGKTSKGSIDFPKLSQQARQLDGMALSIKDNKPSIVPGEMGRRDVIIISAIYEAMRTGKRVEIKK